MRFMFKNHWVVYDEYLRIATSAWNSYYTSDPFFMFFKKLNTTRTTLIVHKWEDASLNHLIMACKLEQEQIMSFLDKDPNNALLLMEAKRVCE